MSYISGTKNDQKLNLLNLTKYKFFVKYFKKQYFKKHIPFPHLKQPNLFFSLQ